MAIGFSGGGSSAPYFATNYDDCTAFAVLHGGVFTGGIGDNITAGWFSTGTQDSVRTPSSVESAAESMKSLGFSDVVYYDFDGGHSLISSEKKALIDWWLN